MMSTLPQASIAVWTSWSGASPLVRSPAKTAVSPSISPAVCCAPSPSRSLMTTLAPWALSSSAVARPIPRAEPVTIATLSSRTPIRSPPFGLRGAPFSRTGGAGRRGSRGVDRTVPSVAVPVSAPQVAVEPRERAPIGLLGGRRVEPLRRIRVVEERVVGFREDQDLVRQAGGHEGRDGGVRGRGGPRVEAAVDAQHGGPCAAQVAARGERPVERGGGRDPALAGGQQAPHHPAPEPEADRGDAPARQPPAQLGDGVLHVGFEALRRRRSERGRPGGIVGQ